MAVVEKITRHYSDGTVETVSAPPAPYDAANPDKRHLGLTIGNQRLFPDGSWQEISSLGVVNHKPAPLDGQYPRERHKMIYRYWQMKYEMLSNRFDKLKNQLSRRGSSFKVQVGNEQIDAVERLKQLRTELSEAIKMERKAAEALTPQRQVSDEEIMRSQVNDARFYQEIQSIKRPEREEVKQPQRHSKR